MQYLRKVDFARLNASTKRTVQMLLERQTGATTCKILITRATPGSGSPRGLHEHSFDQMFYVLSGQFAAEIGGQQLLAGPGTLVVMPKGVPHRNWTPDDAKEPTVFLEFLAPLPAQGETRDSTAEERGDVQLVPGA